MIDIRGLAYVVAESTDLARWKTYAEGVLGMMTRRAADGLYLKMDERQFRILVLPGARDAYVASGWEVLGRGRIRCRTGHAAGQRSPTNLATPSCARCAACSSSRSFK
jgi:hypothetical protein